MVNIILALCFNNYGAHCVTQDINDKNNKACRGFNMVNFTVLCLRIQRVWFDNSLISSLI
jgi:hypothetical protein